MSVLRPLLAWMLVAMVTLQLCHLAQAEVWKDLPADADAESWPSIFAKRHFGTTPSSADPGVGEISGDPRYYQFDDPHNYYQFHGTCNYVICKTIENVDTLYGLQEFAIFTSNVPRNTWQSGASMTVAKDMTLELWGMTFIINAQTKEKVKVNGVEYEPGQQFFHTTSDDYVMLSTIGSGWPIFITSFGLKIRLDSWETIQITLPVEYAGRVTGMLGNFNGDPDDDKLKPDGTTATDDNDFGNSWKDSERSAPGCLDGVPPTPAGCIRLSGKIFAHNRCYAIKDPAGPFRYCHAYVPHAAYFRGCVDDMCADGNSNDRNAINAWMRYAQICLAAGIQVDLQETRLQIPFEPQCGQNMEYTVNAQECPSVCSTIAPLCTTERYTGCQCKPDYQLSGNQCVPADKCGCLHEGVYHSRGESWDYNCDEQCTCDDASGSVVCVSAPCPSYMQCVDSHCRCTDDSCDATCTVDAGGVLTSPAHPAGLDLEDEAKHTVAEKGGDNDPCKAQVRVRIDAQGDVEWVGINLGQHPSYPHKYYRNYAFDFKGDGVLVKRGFKAKPSEEITDNPYTEEFGAYYVVITGDSTDGWTLQAWCYGGHALTLYYRAFGHQRFDLDVPDQKNWSEICFVKPLGLVL